MKVIQVFNQILHFCYTKSIGKVDNMANIIDKKSFGIKLKNIREKKNFSLRQVSQQSKTKNKAAISPSYWSLIERGLRSIPKPSTLERMAKGLRISPDEIMELAGYIESSKTKNMVEFEQSKLIDIPVVGIIKAGPDGLAMQDYQGTEFAMKDDLDSSFDYFWLIVTGDSMVGDGINDGDYALIKKTCEFNNGDICAVIVDGEEGTLKHVTKEPTSIVLAASNLKYQPRVFIGKEMNEIMIAGKLVRTMRKY